MPNRTSLIMLFHGLDASKSCWEIALISATDVNSPALSGAFLFNALCTFPVLFENAMLNFLPSLSPALHFFHNFFF